MLGKIDSNNPLLVVDCILGSVFGIAAKTMIQNSMYNKRELFQEIYEEHRRYI